jgi:hypothetical protein
MASVIFQNIVDKINTSSENINNYFGHIDSYDNNMYNIISKIPKYNLIVYIFIVLVIYAFVNNLNIRLNEILTWIVCVIVLYFLIKKDYSDFISYTNDKSIQLKFLHAFMFEGKDFDYAKENNIIIKPVDSIQKSYLYLNPLIVQLFYNLREYSQYNISSYTNALIHSNNIIGLEYQARIGLDRKYYNYEQAVDELRKALNEINAVIYNLPSTIVSYTKFNNSIKILHGLLNKHIYDMGQIFKNDNKGEDLNLYKMPDSFYDEYFKIAPNNTNDKDYISTFDVY